jgi:hypothetical protein
MASVWCADLQSRPIEFLDVTSVTLGEFPRFCRKVAFSRVRKSVSH